MNDATKLLMWLQNSLSVLYVPFGEVTLNTVQILW
jgi:hypothetical protein